MSEAGPISVLVVDDNQGYLEAAVLNLRSHGYDAVGVDNPNEADRIIEERGGFDFGLYDKGVLELHDPEQNRALGFGYGMHDPYRGFRHLRSLVEKGIKVGLMTGEGVPASGSDFERDLGEAGVRVVFAKPIDPAELRTWLDTGTMPEPDRLFPGWTVWDNGVARRPKKPWEVEGD